MVKKKGAEKDAPVGKLDKKESLMHYNAVLIEELDSRMRLVLECVKASAEETARRFTLLEKKLDQRTSTLELGFPSLKDEMDRRFAALEEKLDQPHRREVRES